MPDRGDLTARARPRGLAAGYGARPSSRDVSFALHAGERMGVLGPNGGGKTTLFRRPARRARAHGRDAACDPPASPSCRRPSARGSTSRSARSTWRSWARSRRCRGGGARGARERRAARAALAAVGLAEQADATFGDLSGGQRQRVLVARALVQDARVILLDEPFTGLDAPSTERLEALLGELAGEGRARDDRHARRRPGARLGQRAVPQPPPGRLRRAGRDAAPRRARGDLRRRDRRAAGRRAARRPPTTTTTDARRAAHAHRSVEPTRSGAARSLEVALLGVDRRRAGLLDRLLQPLLQRRVAGPRRCCRGSSLAALLGHPAAARRRSRPARRRDRDRRRRPGAGHRPRHRRGGGGHRRCSAPACCSPCRRRSPPGLQSCSSATCSASRTADLGLAAGLAVLVVGGARAAARPAARRRLRPLERPRARRAPAGRRPRAARARRARRCSSPCRAWATCSSSPCFVAPACGRAPAGAPHGPDDGGRRPRSRVVAGIGGLYLSYYAGTAAGASIAAMLVAAYLWPGSGRGVAARA